MMPLSANPKFTRELMQDCCDHWRTLAVFRRCPLISSFVPLQHKGQMGRPHGAR